ncbi:MAG: pilus assembly protein TadG-related protein, partial [Thermomicrobiales bacterium]
MNPCARAIASRPHPVRVIGRRRSGMTLVYVALVLSLLLGMAGLVLDGGRMMAERRHAQSAADAGATAA